jgi:hypothetical protein
MSDSTHRAMQCSPRGLAVTELADWMRHEADRLDAVAAIARGIGSVRAAISAEVRATQYRRDARDLMVECAPGGPT